VLFSAIKNSLHIFRHSTLLQASLWLSSVGVAGGILGYVFQILMGRLLTPADFSLFSALMGLTMFFMSPMGAMGMLVSKRVSVLRVFSKYDVMRHLYLRSHFILALVGVGFIAILAIASPTFQEYLKATSPIPIWIFSTVIVFSALNTITNAFFQGQQQFAWLGFAGLAATLARILFSVTFVSLGWGVSGAIFGVLLSIGLVWCVGTAYTLKKLPSRGMNRQHPLDPFPVRTVMPVLVANVAFAAMTQLDVVLVNYYFETEEAGLYAAASILGKAVLYLPGGLVMVLFPMAAEQHAAKKASKHLLVQAAGATVLFCGAAAIFCGLLGPVLVEVFYGPQYSKAGTLLAYYGWAILPMALVMVAEHFLIAKGRVVFAWLFLAVAPFQLLVIHLWHPSLESVILVLGVGGCVMVIIGYGMLFRVYLRQ
jgi:O-antigen/teichoic acid export membrane protein